MTAQVLIVSLTVLAIVAVIAFAKWRTDVEQIAGEDRRQSAAAAEREDRRLSTTAEAARTPRPVWGPDDGAKLGVHIPGGQLIQGTRVMRGAREAEGWIVLADAELLEGVRATPLGGKQWLPAGSWMQELG